LYKYTLIILSFALKFPGFREKRGSFREKPSLFREKTTSFREFLSKSRNLEIINDFFQLDRERLPQLETQVTKKTHHAQDESYKTI
jgi:hypothetical protein